MTMQHESRQPTKEPSPDAAASKNRRAPLDWLARHKKLCLSIGAGLIALAVGAAVCIPLWEGRTVPIAAEDSSAAEPADSTVSPEASRIESIPAESLSASLPQETSTAPANSFVLSSAAKAPGASPPVSSQGPVRPTLPLPDAEPLFAAPEERLTDLTMMEDNTIDSIICYLDGWIYFWESGKGGLVARMRPDGSERETLCGNVGYVCPVEDQGIIYYTPKKYVDEEWTQGDIRTLNLTDRSQTTLPTPTGVNRIWVHDGWILYRCDSTRTNTDGPLYAMRTDGSDLVRLADRCSRVVFNDSWAVIGEPEESGMLFCHTMTCFCFQNKTKQVFQLDGTQPTPCLIQGEELYFTMMYQTDIEFRNHPCYNASLYRLHLGDFTMEKLAEYEGVNSIYGLTPSTGCGRTAPKTPTSASTACRSGGAFKGICCISPPLMKTITWFCAACRWTGNTTKPCIAAVRTAKSSTFFSSTENRTCFFIPGRDRMESWRLMLFDSGTLQLQRTFCRSCGVRWILETCGGGGRHIASHDKGRKSQ